MLINIEKVLSECPPPALKEAVSGMSGDIEFSDLVDRIPLLCAISALHTVDVQDKCLDIVTRIAMRMRHTMTSVSSVNTAIDYYFDLAGQEELDKAKDVAYVVWRTTVKPMDWIAFRLTEIDYCDAYDLLWDITEATVKTNPAMENVIKTMLVEELA